MKKRILIVLLTLALAVALVIPMAIPVAGSGGTTLNLSVQGYEIFAGIVSGGNRYGATFIAQVSGDYNGALTVSTNYKGASPVPGKENDIIGGSWTLTLTQNGKTVGTIVGKISGGTVDWYPRVSVSPPVVAGTDYGLVTTPITLWAFPKHLLVKVEPALSKVRIFMLPMFIYLELKSRL
jgi:hypothetical protein